LLVKNENPHFKESTFFSEIISVFLRSTRSTWIYSQWKCGVFLC